MARKFEPRRSAAKSPLGVHHERSRPSIGAQVAGAKSEGSCGGKSEVSPVVEW